ncbi:MAG: M24 family metallopeptidase [Epsilonproteobacteria bacterium]|nr:M24 family metallopeptidase [Campylobacterota bacterium]
MKNFILQNEDAIYFECGYSCDNAIYISLGSETFFITDGRYEVDVKENIKNNSEIIIANDLLKEARKVIKKSKIKKLHFDPNDFSVAAFETLSTKLDIKFIQKPNFSKLKRIIKTENEIKLIQTAMKLGRDGFTKFAEYIANDGFGKSEQYLAYMAQTFLSQSGKYDLSFNPIIAINENAAKPHAVPTSKIYQDNDLLLFDGGIKFERYCSDRTVTFGTKLSGLDLYQREQKFSKIEQQKVYDIVLKAQQTQINSARIGMKASKLDSIGREIIEKAGYGKYFVHSTGHGVGLDIHEYPNISSRSDFILEENMVFTIEPGIYLANDFGIRIEDTVVLKKDRCLIL